MRKIDMSVEEYMELKKELSEALVGEQLISVEESVKSLAETFNVPEQEAYNVLKECGNDLKTAIKVLRMKNLEL